MTYENFVQVQLAAPLGSSDTSLTLTNPKGAHRLPPATGGILVLADSMGSPQFTEIVRYASRTGNTLNGLTRGLEGTTARAWVAGTFCYQSLTSGQLVAELGAKAPLDSPEFTGNPTAPTPAAEDADTSIATTAFVRSAMGLFGLGADAPDISNLNTLVTPGQYVASSSATGFPPGALSRAFVNVQRSATSTTFVGQTATFPVDYTGGVGMAERFSQDSGATWGAWQSIWHTGNLVKQTGQTDTTAGALMAVGAFGVGGHLGLPDPNQPAAGGGFYGHDFNETSTTTTGYPRLGDGHLRYWNTIAFGLGNRKTEITSEVFGVATQRARTFIRVKHDDNWSAWRELYTQASILGAVSQSGGVPTGAIIERGSNSNGEYIRYADGSQICHHHYAQVVVPGVTAWTFANAASFSVLPTSIATYSADANTLDLRMGMENYRIDGATVYVHNTSTMNREVRVFFKSIGRWY